MKLRDLFCFSLTAFVLAPLSASDFADAKAARQPIPHDVTVQAAELFAAIEAGDVEAKFIPLGAERANVLLTNKTDRVLGIELPEAIAAVPILGQFGNRFGGNGLGGNGFGGNGFGGNGAGGNGFGGQQFGGQQGGGGTQGVGGGFGGVNQGGNNGFLRIPPGKMRKVAATTVCLEHGKPEPNPRIEYRMMPITDYTSDTRLHTLCAKVGTGEIKQNTGQAIAWNLANNLSWERLAKENRVESRYLGNIRRFTNKELKDARAFVFVESFSDLANDETDSSGGL